jgi:hypothetical protein
VTALLEQKDKSTQRLDLVFPRKRLLKVEMQFLASLLLRGALLFSAMAKK